MCVCVLHKLKKLTSGSFFFFAQEEKFLLLSRENIIDNQIPRGKYPTINNMLIDALKYFFYFLRGDGGRQKQDDVLFKIIRKYNKNKNKKTGDSNARG